MHCNSLAWHVDDEVELEGIEHLLVSWAHGTCRPLELLRLKQSLHLRVWLEIEEVRAERLHAAHQRAVALFEPFDASAENVVFANIDAPGQHALGAGAVWHEEGMAAAAVTLSVDSFADVLVRGAIEAEVGYVCREHPPLLGQSQQLSSGLRPEQVRHADVWVMQQVRWDRPCTGTTQRPAAHDGKNRREQRPLDDPAARLNRCHRSRC